LQKLFVTFYRIFQEMKKKGQISRKFVSLNLPYKIFRILVGETLETFLTASGFRKHISPLARPKGTQPPKLKFCQKKKTRKRNCGKVIFYVLELS
jgi:hypothetical protein